jgi:hypothetical protein
MGLCILGGSDVTPSFAVLDVPLYLPCLACHDHPCSVSVFLLSPLGGAVSIGPLGGAVSIGRARLMTGLIELEIKDAFPVGSVSLTTAMA